MTRVLPWYRTFFLSTLFLLLILIFSNANAEEAATELQKEPQTHVELSYVNTSGNTETETLATKLDIKRGGMRNRFSLTGNALYAKSDDKETSSKLRFEGRGERVLPSGLFISLTAGYIRDRFSGYKYRVYAGPGIGYDLIRTNKHRLENLISLFYYYDEFSAGTMRYSEYLTGKSSARYEWRIKEDLKLKENLDYIVSSEDTDNYFIDYETGLEIKINNMVSIGLTYLINYQNLLPSPEVKRTDTTYLTTLIIDF